MHIRCVAVEMYLNVNHKMVCLFENGFQANWQMFYTLHNNPTIRFHRKHNLDSRVSFEKRMAQSPVNESSGGLFSCCKRRNSTTAVIPYDEPIATKVQHERTQIDFLQIKMIEEKILFLQYKSLLLEKDLKTSISVVVGTGDNIR